ncbi:MAG: uracil-DNA glycosylase [Spirochaetia bacterium]
MNLNEFEAIFNIKIPTSWRTFFCKELKNVEFISLIYQVIDLYEKKVIYPPKHMIWNAFILTPLEKIHGVLIGQDPYHGPRQACGLAFSLPCDQKITPSLRNILKEVARTTGAPIQPHGDISHWAKQGIFLINSFLTVEENLPLSHHKLGWEGFTDHLIAYISEKKHGLFFFLWGKEAQKKESIIYDNAHLILKTPHPSPLSRSAFVGCGCFSKANEFLICQKKAPINW